MKKPNGCVGCPLYGTGEGFEPDQIVPGAAVDVWLERPGGQDELEDVYLPAAGLEMGKDVSIKRVVRCRPLKDGFVPKAAVTECRQYDSTDTLTIAPVAVAAGQLAWKHFDGPGSVHDWRGFPHPHKKVLCVLHPADLRKNPAMKLPSMQDWGKLENYRAGTWPEPTPAFDVCRLSGSSSRLGPWVDSAITQAPFVVVDTEFTRDTRYLLTLGLGYPGQPGMQLWFQDFSSVDRSSVRNDLIRLFERVPVVFQNAMADIPVIEKAMGITYRHYCRVEDTMLAHAVLWSEWPHDLGYLASLYGKYQKMKHLSEKDPELYNWGDVLDTIGTWQGVSRELQRDPLSEAVYREQSLPLVPILLRRARKGIRVDTAGVTKAVADLEVRQDWARNVAAATVGRTFNLGSEKQLKAYLYGERGYPEQKDKDKKLSIGGDAIATLRKLVGTAPPDLEYEAKEGLDLDVALNRILTEDADPVLEARVIYAAAKQELTHFLEPLRGQERIYPSVKIHAQASGRWSITEPPLQQFPSYLSGLLVPDDGEVWIGWDWDQIELRLLAALANDVPYLQAFERDWDVHTLNACDIFSLPKPPNPTPKGLEGDDCAAWRLATGWIGKDDLRRTFSKRFVYRLNYGGDPRMAGDIPGARQLGLTGPKLVDASRRYLLAHPAMAAWRVQTAADAQATRQSRTFMGRRRRLFGDGRGVVREAYNHPMQGGVADILNICTVRIAAALPHCSLVYTVHDAAWWAVPVGRVDDAKATILDIITASWSIGGVQTRIPAKFKSDRMPER